MYYREAEEEQVQNSSFAFISKVLNHDRAMTHTFNIVLLALVKQRIAFDTVHLWSDGCSAQFKNKFCFFLLTKIGHSLKLFWQVFESHHGKGSVDGIWGSVKNMVYRKVLSKQVIITTSQHFATFANQIMSNVKVLYIDQDVPDPCKDVSVPVKVFFTLKLFKVTNFTAATNLFLT